MGTPINLVDAAIIQSDGGGLSENRRFRVTLDGSHLSRTLGNPTNITDGQGLFYEITQGGPGGRLLILGTKFSLPIDISRIDLSTDPGAMDMLAAVYSQPNDKLFVTGFMQGYNSSAPPPTPPPSGAMFVTSQILGRPRNNHSGCVGVAVKPQASITINALARWKIAGNTQKHTVYVMDRPGSVLASAVVDMQGGPIEGWVWADIPPLVLPAAPFYLLSSETKGGDKFYDNDTTVVTSDIASVIGSAYSDVCGQDISANTKPGTIYGPVNFMVA